MIPVAVSQRVDKSQKKDEFRDALDIRMTSWLLEVGLSPFPVPNGFSGKVHLEDWLDYLQPKAVLLSGGNDLGESKERDQTERKLVEYAERNELPLLGICRGMQFLAFYFGCELKEVEGHVNTFHDLVFEGSSVRVNSFHRFSLDSAPDEFRVAAASSDGEIEAVVHKLRNWEGWMWHPERESPYNPLFINRAKKIFGIIESR